MRLKLDLSISLFYLLKTHVHVHVFVRTKESHVKLCERLETAEAVSHRSFPSLRPPNPSCGNTPSFSRSSPVGLCLSDSTALCYHQSSSNVAQTRQDTEGPVSGLAVFRYCGERMRLFFMEACFHLRIKQFKR